MSLLQDVKFAVRMLLREPGFTAVVVAALALGIGVNTTVFTLVNAVLFRGLPYEDSDRVMYVAGTMPSKNQTDIGVSYPDLRDWRAQSKTFKGLAAWSNDAMLVSDGGAPERYNVPKVTVNTFPLLGQKPLLGRNFLPEEERPAAAPVCMIAYSVWDSRYGRDANILGRSVRINNIATTIVGVMPKDMKFPMNSDLWIPLVPTGNIEKRDERGLKAFGRLADGVSLASARNEMEVIGKRLEKAYPKSNEGVSAGLRTFNEEFNGGQIRTVFLALLGAVGFVLMIACANVANLLLARSLARAREISIRTALGAGRWRVIRQLLVESVLLGLLGGAVGLGIAYWGVHLFDLATANVGKPYWITFKIDLTVFAYLAAICVFTGLLFGLAPALQLSKLDLNSTLKEGGRGNSAGGRSRYLAGFLVVSEVALSLVLLVGAGLMIRSFLNMYGMTSGLHAERFLLLRLSLPDEKYRENAARQQFCDRLEQRLSAVPGLESAAVASHVPLNGNIEWKFEIEGRPPVADDRKANAAALIVGPAYFQTLGIPIVRGRGFGGTDGLAGKESAIINQRFASKYWPGEDPVGKRIRLQWDGARPWLTVVGVSQDFLRTRADLDVLDPVIYVPYRGRPLQGFSILARAGVAPTSLTSALRKEIQGIDGDLAVYGVQTLQEQFAQQRWPFRVFGTLFALFALIALLLSSMGLYAVMSYAVTRRTQEIGVRLAMGATARNILFLVLSHGLRQLGIGLGIGLAAAFGLARVLKGLLVQVTPTDPATFVVISAILVAVGVIACWIPARWAMKLDPTVALRYE